MPSSQKVRFSPTGALKRCSDGGNICLIRPTGRKNDRLLATVRDLALKQQRDHPQVFLSVRSAAHAFNVPLSAAAEVYLRLREEGVLSTMRGSCTMLRGKASKRPVRFNGVVGIPVSLRRFLTVPDYRECYLRLRDELFGRGFPTRCRFFQGAEPDVDGLVTDFAAAHVSAVVSILPAPGARELTLRLQDRGIRFIGVGIAALAEVSCRYEVRRRRAISALFRSWRREAQIRTVTIVHAAEETKSERAHVDGLEAIAAVERIQCDFTTVSKRKVASSIASLLRSSHPGVVIPAPAASLLGTRQPEAVTRLIAACRVALVDGPIELAPSFQPLNGAADIVAVDWSSVAKRIASDAATGKASGDADPIIFEAQPMLRVPLEKLARPL